jgi:hypothetical protein
MTMGSNIEATKAALEVAQPADRLWLLKQASKRIVTINLGGFCRQVGASEDELGKLLLDRAAQDGLRPESDLIK